MSLMTPTNVIARKSGVCSPNKVGSFERLFPAPTRVPHYGQTRFLVFRLVSLPFND
jgi:hypothetical protein